ncbi:MAG: hypothetical protein FGM27_03640 [Candidatus Omnitrophica bacterium]|nr:hypothetical protein [Candidatus Omnitrophota bacterium]
MPVFSCILTGENMEKYSRTVILSQPLKDDEEIQYAITRYNDRFFFDVRIWFKSPQAQNYRPGRKGISLPIHRLTTLREGLSVLADSIGKAPGLNPRDRQSRKAERPSAVPAHSRD